jgi:hypothetical protein
VLSVANRDRIVNFLYVVAERVLVKQGVKLKFEKEDMVFMVVSSSSGSHPNRLLSNFPNFANLHRMSMSSAGLVFDVSMVENSSAWSRVQANLVVTHFGLLAFEKDGDFQFERTQKLLRIIPVVEFMQVELADERMNSGKKGQHAKSRLTIKYKFEQKLTFEL